jgi:hypothetical protein
MAAGNYVDNPVRVAGYFHCIVDLFGIFLAPPEISELSRKRGIQFCAGVVLQPAMLSIDRPAICAGRNSGSWLLRESRQPGDFPDNWLGSFFLAILLMGTAIRQRKTLGGQNVKEGLLTGGLYRIFRHPIYTGVILASLGVALVTRSWDGLLMFPLVFLLNMVQALIEEKFDIGVRFPGQHQEYKKRTGMFGPTWVWGIVMGLLVAASLLHFG